MNRRMLILFIPLTIFLLGCIFLYRGLFSDPSKLESVLIEQPVPEFALTSLQNPDQTFSRSIFTGQPMLLNVWATWCPTCYAEHEYLNELKAREGIYIVGMNYKDERTKALRWLKNLGNPYAIDLYDPDGMLGLDLGVYGAPETFLIDSQGIIRYRHVGDVNDQVWQQTLKPIFEQME
ncbi:DsbE family thiol:disulfide interchange protein [Oceanisphaera pacifica]|uniref:DsbE family thiol:disulfide interchange protein n=1 Tax=Oceanisphaera pacifica TaxID=2818389 RepID=A0ABS3NGT4_9GAMM|nr:DsbE family thiol:disulfide interchange protein [Oceanisphaera pacifica]MBO1519806.1 DsbE family thiol:disulfide interchange protein [Oceanisphaera pacifica]